MTTAAQGFLTASGITFLICLAFMALMWVPISGWPAYKEHAKRYRPRSRYFRRFEGEIMARRAAEKARQDLLDNLTDDDREWLISMGWTGIGGSGSSSRLRGQEFGKGVHDARLVCSLTDTGTVAIRSDIGGTVTVGGGSVWPTCPTAETVDGRKAANK